MVGTIPAHALYFAGYELSKSTLQPSRTENEKSPWVHFASGMVAEVCGATIWVPMDIVKQRLQAQRTEGVYRSSFHAVQTIHAKEGLRGFFRGYSAALATYGPFVGIYFVAYEQGRRAFLRMSPELSHVSELPFGANLGKHLLTFSHLSVELSQELFQLQ